MANACHKPFNGTHLIQSICICWVSTRRRKSCAKQLLNTQTHSPAYARTTGNSHCQHKCTMRMKFIMRRYIDVDCTSISTQMSFISIVLRNSRSTSLPPLLSYMFSAFRHFSELSFQYDSVDIDTFLLHTPTRSSSLPHYCICIRARARICAIFSLLIWRQSANGFSAFTIFRCLRPSEQWKVKHK